MSDAQASIGAYRIVRQLGARAHATYAAVHGAYELVIVQRFARSPDSKSTDAIQREAQCLAKNWHPNIARVKAVEIVGNELLVATEFIDGITLQDFLAVAPKVTPQQVVRILLDVLAGLGAIHGLADEAGSPLGAIHGSVCPANIVIGKDGVARLIAPFHGLPIRVTSASEALHYSAPEALDDALVAGLRSDLYSCGSILWEALQGKPLFAESAPARILERQRSEDIPWTAAPASVVARLGAVVLKALTVDQERRFRAAAELTTAMRRMAGKDIATGSSLAQKVVEIAGERIRARRAELDAATSIKTLAAAPEASPLPPNANTLAPHGGPVLPTSRASDPMVTERPGAMPPEMLPEAVRVIAPVPSRLDAPIKAPAVVPKSDPRLRTFPSKAEPTPPKSDPALKTTPAVAKTEPSPKAAAPAPTPKPPVPAAKLEPLKVSTPPNPTKPSKLEPLKVSTPPNPTKVDPLLARTPPGPAVRTAAMRSEPPPRPPKSLPQKTSPLLVTSPMVTSAPPVDPPLLVSVPPRTDPVLQAPEHLVPLATPATPPVQPAQPGASKPPPPLPASASQRPPPVAPAAAAAVVALPPSPPLSALPSVATPAEPFETNAAVVAAKANARGRPEEVPKGLSIRATLWVVGISAALTMLVIIFWARSRTPAPIAATPPPTRVIEVQSEPTGATTAAPPPTEPVQVPPPLTATVATPEPPPAPTEQPTTAPRNAEPTPIAATPGPAPTPATSAAEAPPAPVAPPPTTQKKPKTYEPLGI